MFVGHELEQPTENVGATLAFVDGTTSRVFRETRFPDAATARPTVLVIAFRLAFLDDLAPLHAGFRHECLIHTPLFAGFPGIPLEAVARRSSNPGVPRCLSVGRRG